MYCLGIDLGGTKIAVGIVDDGTHIVVRGSVPTRAPRPAEEIAADIRSLADSLLAQAGIGWRELRWAGMGTPGTANCETGIIEYASNLGFENVPMVEILKPLLGIPVYLENDANAAAYGEYLAGAAKGAHSAVCITLGTGVGSGVILEGGIYHGYNYAGGEFGHTVIVADGRPCSCGRKGCLEAYASATGLIAMTKEAMLETPGSAMWGIAGGEPSGVNGRTAFDAMRLGDLAGKRVVNRYLYYLGQGLVNAVNLFQPEVLCIGGGICAEGEGILKPLRETIERERFSRHAAKQTRLCTAALGNSAGIVGAAMLGKIM